MLLPLFVLLIGVGIAVVIYTILTDVEEKSVVRSSLRQLDGYEVESVRDQELLVPLGTGERFEAGLAQLTPAEKVRWRNYRVRPGDNLISIAKKFHTNAGLIRRVNNINGSSIKAGASLMIPSSDWTSNLAIAEQPQPPTIGYQVRAGDSLSKIAGKYKVSVEDLVAWNSLDPGQYLKPGQTLKLHVAGG